MLHFWMKWQAEAKFMLKEPGFLMFLGVVFFLRFFDCVYLQYGNEISEEFKQCLKVLSNWLQKG